MRVGTLTCVRVWIRRRIGVCACTCNLTQHAKLMLRVILLRVAYLVAQDFSTLSHKQRDFQKDGIEHKMCVIGFSVQVLYERLLILRKIQRDIVMNVKTSPCKVPVILIRFQ